MTFMQINQALLTEYAVYCDRGHFPQLGLYLYRSFAITQCLTA